VNTSKNLRFRENSLPWGRRREQEEKLRQRRLMTSGKTVTKRRLKLTSRKNRLTTRTGRPETGDDEKKKKSRGVSQTRSRQAAFWKRRGKDASGGELSLPGSAKDYRPRGWELESGSGNRGKTGRKEEEGTQGLWESCHLWGGRDGCKNKKELGK